MVGKGKKRKQYFPDYLASYSLKGKAKPVLIIDAKHPDEAARGWGEKIPSYMPQSSDAI